MQAEFWFRLSLPDGSDSGSPIEISDAFASLFRYVGNTPVEAIAYRLPQGYPSAWRYTYVDYVPNLKDAGE
mgnify:CR=1 FL=1